ncbi:MAG: 5'-methylthioadenosine/adenosylhomocysteine nucleosidase [Muribaculaceae bacterium]|nr:5'-methylthioadenosine/adenosylhomocysteine nucleosidase [Muribaculaceae bacterium]
MKIGIIVAMDKEMALLLPLLRDSSEISINDTVFHTGTIERHDVVLCKCGIGKVNAAVGTLTLIENFHPSLIINTGVAGGTGAGDVPAQVMDLVMASRIGYHDVWCGPGTEAGQAAGYPAFFENPLPREIRDAIGAKEGLIASGDIFVDRKEDLERILALYPDALAVDMESAAIAQVCHLKHIMFVCLRVVSDTPGENGNAMAYCDFWNNAPKRAFESVERLLRIL